MGGGERCAAGGPAKATLGGHLAQRAYPVGPGTDGEARAERADRSVSRSSRLGWGSIPMEWCPDGALFRWDRFRSSTSRPNKTLPGLGRLGRLHVAAAAPGGARLGVDRDGRGAGAVDVRAPGARVDVAQPGRPLAPKPPPLQLGHQVGVAHFGQIEGGHAAWGICSGGPEASSDRARRGCGYVGMCAGVEPSFCGYRVPVVARVHGGEAGTKGRVETGFFMIYRKKPHPCGNI